MLNMQTFYQLLCSDSTTPDSYLDTLVAMTESFPGQLSALVNDLGWQEWEGNLEIPTS